MQSNRRDPQGLNSPLKIACKKQSKKKSNRQRLTINTESVHNYSKEFT